MAILSTDPAAQDVAETPCIRLCTLDDDDICIGCFRSMAEICAWASAANDERRQILALAELRRTAQPRRA